MKPWLPLALLLLAPMGCNRSTRPPATPSLEPVPTVACSEHAPSEHLAPYPAAPALETVEQLDARHASTADYARALAALGAYSNEQAIWAIGAAGVHQRLRGQRQATATCLDAFRARGVIH